jgi:hypothetical protein
VDAELELRLSHSRGVDQHVGKLWDEQQQITVSNRLLLHRLKEKMMTRPIVEWSR